MPVGAYSGKFLRVQVGATILSGAYAWDVDEDAAELDGTSGEDGGFDAPDVGVYSAAIELKLLLDIVSGQYAVIRRGTLLTNLKCWLYSNAALPMFAFPLARVFKSRPGGEVKGRFLVTVNAKSVGTYTQNDPN